MVLELGGSLSKFFQNRGLVTFAFHSGVGKKHYVSNAIGGPLINVPRVTDAMIDLWCHIATIDKPSGVSDFHASIKDHGGFYVTCPGTNGCSISASKDTCGSMLDGPVISNHNMDSLGQQITLFVGLVVLYHCVMEAKIE